MLSFLIIEGFYCKRVDSCYYSGGSRRLWKKGCKEYVKCEEGVTQCATITTRSHKFDLDGSTIIGGNLISFYKKIKT